MYEKIISPSDSISYQDTDSAFISMDCYKKFIKMSPEL